MSHSVTPPREPAERPLDTILNRMPERSIAVLDSFRQKVEEAEAAVTRRNQLRANLTALGDELNGLRNRIDALDVYRERLQASANESRSLSFGGLFSSLFGGGGEASPAGTQDKLDQLEKQQSDAQRQLVDVEQQIRSAEQELSESGDVDHQYEEALREWREARAQAGDDAPDDIAVAGDVRGAVERAIQSATHLKERLWSMSRSIGRARTGRLGRGPGAGILNMLTDQRASGSVDRVRDGFERLHRDVTAIPLREGNFTDDEIARLTPWLSNCISEIQSRSTRAMVNDPKVLGSLVDSVQEILGHLKDKQSALGAGQLAGR
ncbi:MAG: hypothetical protein J5J06_12665 [Phycisphaerae bacterium]|nr:hypothetical protein [Phycisphaerae bacterium]